MHRTMDITARDAAALLASGDAESMAEAIAQACGASDAPPTPSLVRRHLESLQQTSLGMDGWRRMRLSRLEALLEFMDTVAFVAPGSRCMVSGRAAQGHIDDTSPARVRVISVDAPRLLDALEDHDLVPDHIGTLSTSIGQVAQARFSGTDLLVEIMVLPDVPDASGTVNLVDGRPVTTCDLDGFRTLVEVARDAVERED